MKVRMGFVSNSSSCSFMIVASKNVVDTVLNALDDITQKVVRMFMEEKTFMNNQVVLTYFLSGEAGDGYRWDIIELLEEEFKISKKEASEKANHFCGFISEDLMKLLKEKATEYNEGYVYLEQDM